MTFRLSDFGAHDKTIVLNGAVSMASAPLSSDVGAQDMTILSLASPHARLKPAPAAWRRKPYVMFVVNSKHFTGRFMDEWTRLLQSLLYKQHHFDFGMARCYAPEVFHSRSFALGGDMMQPVFHKPWLGDIKYDYIFWIDAEVSFQPEDVVHLYKRMEERPDIQVLSGVYKTGAGEETAVRAMDEAYFAQHAAHRCYTVNELAVESARSPDGLVRAFSMDMGFMMVRQGVYEQIEFPWHKPFYYTGDYSFEFGNLEDSWGIQLQKLGIDLWVDPQVQLGHESTIVI